MKCESGAHVPIDLVFQLILDPEILKLIKTRSDQPRNEFRDLSSIDVNGRNCQNRGQSSWLSYKVYHRWWSGWPGTMIMIMPQLCPLQLSLSQRLHIPWTPHAESVSAPLTMEQVSEIIWTPEDDMNPHWAQSMFSYSVSSFVSIANKLICLTSLTRSAISHFAVRLLHASSSSH